MRTSPIVVVALLSVSVVPLAACTSQPDPVQARITNPARGTSVNAEVGRIRLLATRIDAPEDRKLLGGSNTGLFTTLANDGDAADRLVGVSSVYARQVVMRQGTDGPEAPVQVDVPGNGVVSLQYPGGLHLEMVDLKLDVRAGSAPARDLPLREGRQRDGQRLRRRLRPADRLAGLARRAGHQLTGPTRQTCERRAQSRGSRHGPRELTGRGRPGRISRSQISAYAVSPAHRSSTPFEIFLHHDNGQLFITGMPLADRTRDWITTSRPTPTSWST